MITDINKFNIATDETEMQYRLNLCSQCEQNKENQHSRICFACACPIEYVTTQKYKSCPLGKWVAE